MRHRFNEQFITKIVALLNHYLVQSNQALVPVVKAPGLKELEKELGFDTVEFKRPHSNEEVMEFLTKFLDYSTRLHHPGFIAHQVSTPNQAVSIANFINGIINNGMGVYEMGPSGVATERFVIEWLIKKIGYDQGDGLLVHGGSLANLTALLTARAVVDSTAWENGNSADHIFLVPETSHYSVARAASIMGHGQKSIWKMKTDEHGRVKIDQVQGVIDQAKAQGKVIIALVCNACATATGLYDDISGLADLCEKNKIWFHVDGAHGASALISQKHKELLKGIERADSLIWDMHKMLQTSALCAGVFFKDKKHIGKAFAQDASYLEHEADEKRDDMFLKSVECTKDPIGMRFYLNLFMNGENFFSEYIDATYLKAQKFYEMFEQDQEFTVPYRPESNILLFRYRSGDELQDEIYHKLIADGNFYITKAKHQGEIYLRLTIMNLLTDEKFIERLMKKIKSLM